MTRSPLLCALLVFGACARAPAPAVPPSAISSEPAERAQTAPCLDAAPSLTAAQFIEAHGTVLDAYQREGGVWLARAPVLVNRDFDFALAMSLEGGLGAGLAAAKRKESNQARAASLATFELPPEVATGIAELRCRGAHVYFVLWGAEPSVLKGVIDPLGDAGAGHVIEGKAEASLEAALTALWPELERLTRSP